ncbi:MAG: hypothetical protein ACK56E_12950, partial [Planctomyces sp.]
MPTQFVKWIKSAVNNLIDSERDERIKAIAAGISRGLKEQQKAFSISQFKTQHQHQPKELSDAVQLVWRRLLEKLWSDQVLTDKENSQLSWVQKSLELSDAEAGSLRLEFAEQHFRTALAQAMEDGQLAADEVARLHQIARSVGESADSFAKRFFRKEGES